MLREFLLVLLCLFLIPAIGLLLLGISVRRSALRSRIDKDKDVLLFASKWFFLASLGFSVVSIGGILATNHFLA
mgnify:CR=1 FL=1